jgi:hypothetical protein
MHCIAQCFSILVLGTQRIGKHWYIIIRYMKDGLVGSVRRTGSSAMMDVLD